MDKLFAANIEDREILHKFYADTEILRDTPPEGANMNKKDGRV